MLWRTESRSRTKLSERYETLREEYAARFGFDIRALYRDAKEREKNSKREVVSLEPKPVKGMAELRAQDERRLGGLLPTSPIARAPAQIGDSENADMVGFHLVDDAEGKSADQAPACSAGDQ
jgi:hypothetical protein